ncbi:YxeA family protein, partial [Bacillus gaemokensis]
MKKLLGIVAIIFVGIIVWGIADKEDSLGIKSSMTTEYYVQIDGDGEEKTDENEDGTKNTLNWYKLKAYNAYGDEETVYFFGA